MLKVINIDGGDDRVIIAIRGTCNEDFLMAQEIFRSLIAYYCGVDSTFGWGIVDTRIGPKLEFKYPVSTTIHIVFLRREPEAPNFYGATWKGKPRTRIE